MDQISPVVYRKIISHSLRFPISNIAGFLIGNEKQIIDVVPFSHNPINSALVSIALDLLQKTDLLTNNKIVGLYEVSEQHPEDDSLFLEKKLLSLFQKQFSMTQNYLIRLKVKNNRTEIISRDTMNFQEAWKDFENDKYEFYFEHYIYGTNLKFQEILKNDEIFNIYKEDFNKNLHLQLRDIEEHLDNPTNNFLNSHFNQY